MTIEIFSYQTSILNPLLKLGVVIGFILASYLFFRCRTMFGGILHSISTLLILVSFSGVISALFRYEGDFYNQYKWGESIVGLILVIIILCAAIVIRRKVHEIELLFGSDLEDV